MSVSSIVSSEAVAVAQRSHAGRVWRTIVMQRFDKSGIPKVSLDIGTKKLPKSHSQALPYQESS